MVILPHRRKNFKTSISDGGSNDPYWNNVVLLVHADGSDGSTTIIDSSNSAHTISPRGNVQLDTAQYKWGGSSIIFDGGTDDMTIPDSDDFDFGTGDWTMEWWQRWNAISGYQTFFEHGYVTSGGLIVQTGNGNGLYIVYVSGSVVLSETSSSPSTGVWYHYALVKSGTTITLYRNGVNAGSGTSSVSITSTSIVCFGSRYSTALFCLNGWIDDIRITKGVARYTSNFTSPTEAFPNS